MNDVDIVIWEWISKILINPGKLAERLRSIQEDTIRSNQALFERLDIIERQITLTEEQIEELSNSYIGNVFYEELLQEQKVRLDESLTRLLREQMNVTANIQNQVLSDDQIAQITAFQKQIRPNLEDITLDQKRQFIEMLDVRCTLGLENGNKVVNIKCRLGQQHLLVPRTLS
jgi:regulator of replication initiation timing